MSGTPVKPKNPKDYAVWMRFKDDAAALRLVISPGGQKALLLIVRDRDQLAWMREKATDCGLVQVGEKPLFRALIDADGRLPISFMT